MTTIRDTISRDLKDEIQSVIKVAEASRLAIDLREYVLTDMLAKQFGDVLSALVDSARPATASSGKTGIWVSGFFGSGKSHFAKLIGHLAANTQTPDGSARDVFRTRLRPGNARHDRIAELLQQADNHTLRATLVAFDITALHGDSTENVGRILLRALYRELGLSSVVSFAELEMEVAAAGKREEFLKAYQAASGGTTWANDRDLGYVSEPFGQALVTIGHRFTSVASAIDSINRSEDTYATLTIDGAVKKLLKWHADEQTAGRAPGMIFFVADEVGAWAGRNLQRIEEIRAAVEAVGEQGNGNLWLLATSQERLSDVVQNAGIMDTKVTQDFIQRLQARFGTNVHLEPSEVSTVIEDRVLRKKAGSRPELEALYKKESAWVADVAGKPGLDILGEYPGPTAERFVNDYPFLPYQLPLAADIFGAMRGVKVSSGARSMLGVAFDSTVKLADQAVGAVVSWDQIFDSANRENEFADENYLGSPGLQSIERADRDLAGEADFDRPSRILKVLWLMQQSTRVPCSTSNLARLLADRAGSDVLELERRLEATLGLLVKYSFVRRDAASGQWRFLTPDEVTVEKIVSRIGGDIAAKEVRDEAAKLFAERLRALGAIVVGNSQTTFEYGIQLNGTPLKNDPAPVQLKVWFESLPTATKISDDHAAYIEDSAVYWTVPVPDRLDDRIRRTLAIRLLKSDPKFNEIRTTKTDVEAERLVEESRQIERQAAEDLHKALGSGTLFWGGGSKAIAVASNADKDVPARASIEEAIRDRIGLMYPRFGDGDRKFDERNIDRLLDTPPAKRAALDPDLGLFDADGHVHADHVLAAAVVDYLNGTTKTAGSDLRQHFTAPKFGWPPQLPRYVSAGLFVDGRVALVDKSGKRHDNPKTPEARVVLGSKEFGSTRVVVEDQPPTPEEARAVRELLQDLGEATKDDSVLTLHEGARVLLQRLEKRLGIAERAKAAQLPLPAAIDALRDGIDDVAAATSRTASLRALLAQGAMLREGVQVLSAIESFVEKSGLDQFQRAETMVTLCDQIGLDQDEEYGVTVQDAKAQIEELKAQRRVIAEWTTGFESARQALLSAYRARYAPAYAAARATVAESRDEIVESEEFGRLGTKNLQVRIKFMGAGCQLQDIPEVPMKSEADVIAASREFSLPLLRARVGGAVKAVAEARVFMDQLLADKPAEQYAAWESSRLIGKAFRPEDAAGVDEVFDKAKDEVKALLARGKTVRVI